MILHSQVLQSTYSWVAKCAWVGGGIEAFCNVKNGTYFVEGLSHSWQSSHWSFQCSHFMHRFHWWPLHHRPAIWYLFYPLDCLSKCMLSAHHSPHCSLHYGPSLAPRLSLGGLYHGGEEGGYGPHCGPHLCKTTEESPGTIILTLWPIALSSHFLFPLGVLVLPVCLPDVPVLSVVSYPMVHLLGDNTMCSATLTSII